MYALIRKTETGMTVVDLVDKRPETIALSHPWQKALDRYFKGELQKFTIDFPVPGTDFQRQVYHATCTIPYGETRSYGWVAEKIGNPKAARAVGQALNKNPLPILIPCHRVIGHDASLVGFGSDISYKIWLLRHEKKTREKG